MNYGDERAAFVKLADRMHNMRTISGHSPLAKQKHIANETLNFFVPLAEKLGLTAIAKELEKLSLGVLAK
jgi:(p)ppGpp synthase/HD superfamily hydrolase